MTIFVASQHPFATAQRCDHCSSRGLLSDHAGHDYFCPHCQPELNEELRPATNSRPITTSQSLRYHPLVGNVVSFGCAACGGTGIIENEYAGGGKAPCGCIVCRETDMTPVPTLTQHLQTKRQQQQQTRPHTQQQTRPVSAEQGAVAAMSQSLTKHLQRGR